MFVLTSCRARGLYSAPGCPPLQNVPRSGDLRLGLGRRAPPWVVGVRRPMPTVANGFVFQRCGDGVDDAAWGEVRTMSVVALVLFAVPLDVMFRCCESVVPYYRLCTVISQTWI